MGIFEKIRTFFSEAAIEMRKVNWPTREETLRYTLIVIGISVGVAVYLAGLDFILKQLLDRFIF